MRGTHLSRRNALAEAEYWNAQLVHFARCIAIRCRRLESAAANLLRHVLLEHWLLRHEHHATALKTQHRLAGLCGGGRMHFVSGELRKTNSTRDQNVQLVYVQQKYWRRERTPLRCGLQNHCVEAASAVRVSARVQLHERDNALIDELLLAEQRGILRIAEGTSNLSGNRWRPATVERWRTRKRWIGVNPGHCSNSQLNTAFLIHIQIKELI